MSDSIGIHDGASSINHTLMFLLFTISYLLSYNHLVILIGFLFTAYSYFILILTLSLPASVLVQEYFQINIWYVLFKVTLMRTNFTAIQYWVLKHKCVCLFLDSLIDCCRLCFVALCTFHIKLKEVFDKKTFSKYKSLIMPPYWLHAFKHKT